MDELRSLKVYVGRTEIAQGLRIRVRGSGNMTLLPDFYMVDIYNLSNADLAAIQTASTLYVNGSEQTTVCYGEIDDIFTRYDNANVITTISLVDGKTFRDTRVEQSVGGGATVRDAMALIMNGAALGPFLARDVRLTRGQAYRGRLPENVSMLAKSAGGWAFLTRNVVYVVSKGKASDIIDISESDVLDETKETKGAIILKTIVKGYPIGVLARRAGRLYRLVSQKISADNFKGDWSSNILLVDEDEIGEMEGG